MKNWKTFVITLAVLALPLAASSAGLEFAVGTWYVNPSGRISYSPDGPNQTVNISNSRVFDEGWEVMFRLKAQPPSLPGIYLQAVPMSFSAGGGTGIEFAIDDVLVNSGDEVESDFFLNVYDAALYFPFPLIKTDDFNAVSLELGAGARWINIRADLDEVFTDDPITSSVLDDSASANVVYPEGYAALQVRPMEKVSIDGEIWGYSWNGDKFWSLVGRLKVKPIGPMMISGGYRYDFYDFDKDEISLDDASFKGPFVELGLQW